MMVFAACHYFIFMRRRHLFLTALIIAAALRRMFTLCEPISDFIRQYPRRHGPEHLLASTRMANY